MEKYGDLVALLEQTKMVRGDDGQQIAVPVAIEDVFPAPVAGGLAADRAMQAEELKEVAKLRAEARANITKVIGFLMMSLHSNVEIKVRAHADFVDAVETKSLARVWRIIKRAVLGSEIANESQGALARQQFARVVQGPRSLEEYIDKLTRAGQLVLAHGVELPEVDRVYQFVLNLDPARYGAVVADWISRETMPTTFDSAVTRITEWSRAKDSLGISGRARSVDTSDTGDSKAVYVSKPARGKCYVCGERGHLARDCSQRKKGAKDPVQESVPASISKPRPRPAW